MPLPRVMFFTQSYTGKTVHITVGFPSAAVCPSEVSAVQADKSITHIRHARIAAVSLFVNQAQLLLKLHCGLQSLQ